MSTMSAPDAAGPDRVGPDRAGGIVARGLRRHFGAVRAVDGVDLDVPPGAVTALIGPNGSGKTTLLLVLAGLLRPDAGTVTVAGLDPATAGREARAAVGWMPDAFGTWDSLTAREVLTTFAAAYRVPAALVPERVAGLLDTVHLTELADRPARVLSRGQKQRLGLARALVHDPQVLLLDEPASGLDPRSRVDLRVLLRRLAGEGRTVLVSSHVLTELDEMADEAVFMSAGRTVGHQSVHEAVVARRPWRLRALSQSGLAAWLDAAGVPWSPDGTYGPPVDAPGSVLVDLDGDAAAADLLRLAVGAGVPVTALAPASGALESTYLAMEEERR
jgi:ABC-2 type transport system ATP-binding protein